MDKKSRKSAAPTITTAHLEDRVVKQYEFAAKINRTPQAVAKAISTGRLVESVVFSPEGKPKGIRLKEGLEEWARNCAPPVGAHIRARNESSGSERVDWRAMKDEYEAKLRRLAFEVQMGNLLDAEPIKAERIARYRLIRNSILSVPDRYAHELASETDAHRLHIILTKALIEALDNAVEVNNEYADTRQLPAE